MIYAIEKTLNPKAELKIPIVNKHLVHTQHPRILKTLVLKYVLLCCSAQGSFLNQML